ncbi:serine hydrolase [Nocardia beijingensis]|uniref:serine hydrolase domain-containing protein n=1 Tax=Nocardia beijingensis TaxID=95162 RepID=UPI0018948AA2|nr:serine hydrolase domain-containing protein [Nocardia beijingensis]MBF6463621.1 serine hydrolase [Nocardia beijingensis]
MNDNALRTLEARILDQVVTHCAANGVPGFVAGVYHGGEQIVIAHGTANAATGAPMLDDTGFLFGSVTKVLTTTLVLQQVERGGLDLDAPVVRYLPEFAPTTPGASAPSISTTTLPTTGHPTIPVFPPLPTAPGAGSRTVTTVPRPIRPPTPLSLDRRRSPCPVLPLRRGTASPDSCRADRRRSPRDVPQTHDRGPGPCDGR